MNPSVEQEHEALMQFLYQAPVGLVECSASGEITMINPMAAQLLMPLASDGQLGNLFDLLAPLAPDLHGRVQASGSEPGTIFDALRLRLGDTTAERRKSAPNTLELRLLRLASDKLMASLIVPRPIASRVRCGSRPDCCLSRM